eukprot:CAMPEP_0170608664 /NCGR_PEP_ID=MMETSP0224-20130122/21706_1 /TAXON_ID=285029 /ORGANISM="Togula jolla, Strain CCCM 725" /LENGTH=41 /DNA_ID= /DNA_START= /DNA_END= /DNA_ORIENTATION=
MSPPSELGGDTELASMQLASAPSAGQGQGPHLREPTVAPPS